MLPARTELGFLPNFQLGLSSVMCTLLPGGFPPGAVQGQHLTQAWGHGAEPSPQPGFPHRPTAAARAGELTSLSSSPLVAQV